MGVTEDDDILHMLFSPCNNDLPGGVIVIQQYEEVVATILREGTPSTAATLYARARPRPRHNKTEVRVYRRAHQSQQIRTGKMVYYA